MSLDKAIKHGKEKRKTYHGSKAFDRTCRNHGGCDTCLSNRMHSNNKRLEKMKGDADVGYDQPELASE